MPRSPGSDAAERTVPAAVGLVAAGVTVVALWAIAYATLFPFDVVGGGSLTAALDRFRLTTGPVWEPRAMPANVLLFAPLGFGLAGLARRRGWSSRTVVFGCTVAGGVLSAAIELVQGMWLARLPSGDDVLANTLGALLGALLWSWGEPRIRAAAGRPVRHASRWRWACGTITLLPVGLGLLGAAAAAGSTDDLDWQPGNWLLLGNEATGDRPWSGSIRELALVDRAVSAAEADAWLDGTPMREITGDSTLVDDRFEQALPAGWERRTAGPPPEDTTGRSGVDVGPTSWLQSPDPADEISERISDAGAFTVAVDATSASLDQTGPGRIVSLSIDPYRRNLTVGQDGADLVIRVRSGLTGPDGSQPEYAVPGFFDDLGPHRFTVSYDQHAIRVTTEGAGSTTLDLQPATAAMLETFVDQIPRFHFSAPGNVLRETWFASFMFAPWCVFLGVVRRRRVLDPATVALVLVPVVVAEVVLTWITPTHDARFAHIAVIGVLAVGLTALVGTLSRRASADGA